MFDYDLFPYCSGISKTSREFGPIEEKENNRYKEIILKKPVKKLSCLEKISEVILSWNNATK